MTKTFKKYLITAVTLVLLALVVLLCAYPFSGEKVKPINPTQTNIDTITNNNGYVRRYDGLIYEGTRDTAAHAYGNGDSEKRFHKPGDATEFAGYTTIATASDYTTFMNEAKTVAKKGVLTADITLADVALNTNVFSEGSVLDGNGYSLNIAAKSTGDAVAYNASSTITGGAAFYGNVGAMWASEQNASAGYMMALNKGTIKNLTVEYTSTMLVPTDIRKDQLAAATNCASDSGVNSVISCVGIIAGISTGTIENVCLDINNPFFFKKNENNSVSQHENSMYLGGVVGLAGRSSKIMKVTVNNLGGLVGFVNSTDVASKANCIVGGVIGNLATGDTSGTVASGTAPSVKYISASGLGQIVGASTSNAEKLTIAAGIIGATVTIPESGELATDVRAVNGAELFGFISSWMGGVRDNHTIASTTYGLQRGMPFGRINPTTTGTGKGVEDIMLLFDYRINGPTSGNGVYKEISIDQIGSLVRWNEAYTIDNQSDSKGNVTAMFKYDSDAKIEGNDYKQIVDGTVFGVALAKSVLIDGEMSFDPFGGLDNIATTASGMVWNVQQKTNGAAVGAALYEQGDMLVSATAKLIGSSKSKNHSYVVEFGEIVNVNYRDNDIIGGRMYDTSQPIKAPRVVMSSAIGSSVGTVDSSGYTVLPTGFDFVIERAMEKGFAKVNLADTVVPGEYYFRTKKVDGGGKNLGYLDTAGKIVALDDTSKSYRYRLDQGTLQQLLTKPNGKWQKSFVQNYQINSASANMIESYNVAVGSVSLPKETIGADGIIRLDYKSKYATAKSGIKISVTPYKTLKYIDASGAQLTMDVAVAPTLHEEQVMIDASAPHLVGYNPGIGETPYDALTYYELNDAGTDKKIDPINAPNGYEILPKPNKDTWREKGFYVEYQVEDDTMSTGCGLSSGAIADVKGFVVKDNAPYDVIATDKLANQLRLTFKFKIDPTNVELKVDLGDIKFGKNSRKDKAPVITFTAKAGAAQATVEFVIIENGIEKRIVVGNVQNTTKTFTHTLNSNITNATLKAVITSEAVDKKPVYVGAALGPNGQYVNFDKKNSVDNSSITSLSGTTVISTFTVLFSTYKITLDQRTIQFSVDGGTTWVYMSTVADWSAMMKKTYDGTMKSHNILFKVNIDANIDTTVQGGNKLDGRFYDGITFRDVNGNQIDKTDAGVAAAITEVNKYGVGGADAVVAITGKYSSANAGGVKFVLTATSTNKSYEIGFWEMLYETKITSSLNLATTIDKMAVSIGTDMASGLTLNYVYGDTISKTGTVLLRSNTEEMYVSFEFLYNAIGGSNVGTYPCLGIRAVGNVDNFIITNGTLAPIVISPKVVEINHTLGGKNDAKVFFDGAKRIVEGYYKNLEPKQINAKASIYDISKAYDDLVLKAIKAAFTAEEKNLTPEAQDTLAKTRFDALTIADRNTKRDAEKNKLALEERNTRELAAKNLKVFAVNEAPFLKDIGRYRIVFAVEDTNYAVSAVNNTIYYEIAQGVLPIDTTLQIKDYDIDSNMASLPQPFKMTFNWPKGVVEADVFNILNLQITYQKYPTCKLDTTDPKNPVWIFEGTPGVEGVTAPTEVGGYDVVMKYVDPAMGGTDKTAGLFSNLTQKAKMVIRKAVMDMPIKNGVGANGEMLEIPWTGQAQTYDMIKAGISIIFKNIMVDVPTIPPAVPPAVPAKTNKVLFNVSNNIAEQPLSKDLRDQLYSLISVKFKTGATPFAKVMAWDIATQQFALTADALSGIGTQTDVNTVTPIPGTFKVHFEGNENYEPLEKFVNVRIVNRKFTFASNPKLLYKGAVTSVYNEKPVVVAGDASMLVGENAEGKFEYTHNGITQNTPFSFTNAGVYNVNVAVTGTLFYTVSTLVTYKITEAPMADDIDLEDVLAQVFDGKPHSPKLQGVGVTFDSGKYYYHGSELKFLKLPSYVEVGREEKKFVVKTDNHVSTSLSYVVEIVPMPVVVTYTMEASVASDVAFAKGLKLAKYTDVDGVEQVCRVEFYKFGTEEVVNVDKETNLLPPGKYSAQIVMDIPNYVATLETQSFDFVVRGGKSNLGLIIGGAVGGVVVLGGIIALTVVLVLKKKKHVAKV